MRGKREGVSGGLCWYEVVLAVQMGSMGEVRWVVGYDWSGLPDWTYLELVLKQVFLGGHFAVEAQQTLLLGTHRLG